MLLLLFVMSINANTKYYYYYYKKKNQYKAEKFDYRLFLPFNSIQLCDNIQQ